jgi:serine/threonine-protein kinase
MKLSFVAVFVAVCLAVGCGGGGGSPHDAGGGTGGSGVGGAAGRPAGGGGDGGGAGGASGTGGAGAQRFTLTVVVNGAGKVTSNPAGVDCGSTCSATFAVGTPVALTATAQGGVLTGWAGACTGAASCSVTLGADSQVTATFAPITVGTNAHGVAVTPDGASALVTLSNSPGSVKVVSLANGSILDTITVGAFPGAIAIAPNGGKAVVNNQNSVSVIDLGTKVVSTVASPCVGDTLYDIAVAPDSATAVTTMFNGSCVTNTLAVIALGSNSLTNQYTIPATITQGVAFVPGGASALVSLGILGTTVKRVALPGGAITSITGTSSSFGIAVKPDGAEALVASGDGDTIKRLSLSTNAVLGSIDYASNQDSHNIAITPDGALAVVVGSFDVGVLSLSTNTVAKTFSGGGRSVAITPDGRRALVTIGSTLKVFALPP